jgi:hypothetical protein
MENKDVKVSCVVAYISDSDEQIRATIERSNIPKKQKEEAIEKQISVRNETLSKFLVGKNLTFADYGSAFITVTYNEDIEEYMSKNILDDEREVYILELETNLRYEDVLNLANSRIAGFDYNLPSDQKYTVVKVEKKTLSPIYNIPKEFVDFCSDMSLWEIKSAWNRALSIKNKNLKLVGQELALVKAMEYVNKSAQ